MPAGDRTGPKGEGPRTGRGAGDCGESVESIAPSGGARRGFGRGFGRRWWNRGQGQRRGMGRWRGSGAAKSEEQ